MIHILFLSQVLPYPLDAGPKMRSYFVLSQLARKHKVTLLAFVRATDRPEDIANLAKICHEVHTVPIPRNRLRDIGFLGQSLLTRRPFLILRDQVPAMITKVRQLVNSESFDVIHADQLWMAQYALIAKAASPKSKVILDQHNAVHLIPRRMADDEPHFCKRRFLAREAELLTIYEPEMCRLFDHVVWVTTDDLRAVTALSLATTNGQISSSVIPICIDPTLIKPLLHSASQRRVTFLGGLHWPPNVQGVHWFVRHVFPHVRAEVPDAVLTVIGKNPPVGLEGEGVEVTGYVTDPLPYLAETSVFIVPLHAGGGMRVKILDAWSWGLPVVSTTIGAEGIEIRDGENILIADTPHAFAQAVERVLKDPALANHLSQNGRQTVTEKYNWRETYTAWDDIYQRLIAIPTASRMPSY